MEKVNLPTGLLRLTAGAYFDLCIRNTRNLRNVTLKGLAGNSVYTYARQADALVIKCARFGASGIEATC